MIIPNDFRVSDRWPWPANQQKIELIDSDRIIINPIANAHLGR